MITTNTTTYNAVSSLLNNTNANSNTHICELSKCVYMDWRCCV